MSVNSVRVAPFSIGGEVLDRQYQRIFEQIDAIPEELGAESIRKAMRLLRPVAMEQFEEEERRMCASGYPRMVEHRRLHRSLLNRLSEIEERPRANSDCFFTLRDLLHNWLQGHILAMDMEFLRFERTCGGRSGVPPEAIGGCSGKE